jgi:DNA-binding response OmpR family regulator
MRILIAEDDPTNQKIARIWLTRRGHSITIVPDGQSCVERYGSEKFDVVLNGNLDASSGGRRGNSRDQILRAAELLSTNSDRRYHCLCDDW